MIYLFIYFSQKKKKRNPRDIAGVANEVTPVAPLVAVGQEGKGSSPENIWERNACLPVSAQREKELSGTAVRRVNKVHLFIPSSFVGCQRLKTGLSKTQPHLFLLVSLHFHTHACTHRQRQRESGAKCVQTQQCHFANMLSFIQPHHKASGFLHEVCKTEG